MSNPESFIEEVTEEVRRDRMSRLLRKYGWIGALGVALIVGGAAFNEYRKAQETAAAQAYGDALYAALGAGSAQTRLLALEEVNAPETGAPLLALITAAESVERPEEAAQALQGILADPASPEIYQDLARLRLVMLGAAALPADERRALLDVLVLGSGPFRLLAMEQRALLEVEAGQRDAAIETLQDVLRAAGTSAGQRQRVAQLIVALGGDVAVGQG